MVIALPKRKSVGSENLIGQNIVFLRKSKGLKQTDLLAQLQVRGIDINQSALSDIEGQNRKVSDRELLTIAEILGVPLDALFSAHED
ncbi:MAG: helix-turn-helix transcriptional regulator [Oscillospiraceae bacterium]|nr:helix-turn-helix transcriptional regulator [Oscillospiraceae bacterium]